MNSYSFCNLFLSIFPYLWWRHHLSCLRIYFTSVHNWLRIPHWIGPEPCTSGIGVLNHHLLILVCIGTKSMVFSHIWLQSISKFNSSIFFTYIIAREWVSANWMIIPTSLFLSYLSKRPFVFVCLFIYLKATRSVFFDLVDEVIIFIGWSFRKWKIFLVVLKFLRLD